MRLHAWGFFAITLMVFGSAEDQIANKSELLHVEVLEVMAPGGCAVTAELARAYLLPEIEGAERLAYVCHTSLRENELEIMQTKAAADNAKRAAARLEPSRAPTLP